MPPIPMLEPPLAAATPTWVWAALVTGAFAAGSVLTMWLARFPVRRQPPGDRPDAGDERRDGGATGP